MPRHLAERVLRSRAALEGERKQVTVLFADVKGSLALIEHADPEDARRILDAALGVMMDGVHRYEGTVNRVLGDGIMALFGAPIAHEDHAVRACYAALAIQRAMQRPGGRAARRPRRRGQRPDRPAFGRGPGPRDRQRPQHGLRRDRPDRPSGEPDGAAGEPRNDQADRGDRRPRRRLRRPADARAGAGEGPVAAGRGVRSGGRRCGAHAPPGGGRSRPHAVRRAQGRAGGARSGARAGRGRPGPDRRPGRRPGRRQVAAVLRAHPRRADAPLAGRRRHVGLLGQRELLGAGGRSAQALLRHRAGRRPRGAAPRRCWARS